MTIWAILSLLIRACGLATWADKLWEKHEMAVKAKEVKDAGANIDRMSDDDVSKRLSSNWLRKDS